MATKTEVSKTTGRLNAGQRLHCVSCSSEVEIIQPCTCHPPAMVLRCCGKDMQPTVGQDVHVSGE